MAVFLHGPLTDEGVRKHVLGRTRAAHPAKLAGLDVAASSDGGGAVLVPGTEANCVLVSGLSTGEIARLTFFQAVLGMQPRLVRDGFDQPTTIYLPVMQAATAQTGAWDAAAFAQVWAPSWRMAAAEIMGWFGRKDPADLALVRPGILRRAWSFAMNAAGADRCAPGREIEQVTRHQPYLNFFAVDEWDLRHTRHDGTPSEVINRGAMLVGNASVVLPYDPQRDTVLLTEQFRAPLAMASEPNPWILEPVAGLIDAGETAEDAARREAMEEAGITLDGLEPAGRLYASTGALAECAYLFVGMCDLSAPPRDGGLEVEGEDIRSRILSFDELMQGVDAYRFVDMPLVTLALWLARHHNRLRG